MEHQRGRITELHEDLRERLQKNNNNDANVLDDDHDYGT